MALSTVTANVESNSVTMTDNMAAVAILNNQLSAVLIAFSDSYVLTQHQGTTTLGPVTHSDSYLLMQYEGRLRTHSRGFEFALQQVLGRRIRFFLLPIRFYGSQSPSWLFPLLAIGWFNTMTTGKRWQAADCVQSHLNSAR